MTINPSTSGVNPFNYEAVLSPASLEQIAKNITVPNGAENLRNCTLHHGTEVSEIPNVFKGPKNVGGGVGDKGLYVALNQPDLAIEYAQIKTQFGGNPGIMEGRLNPEKNFVVGRIQVVRHAHQADLLRGIWPADWSKNPVLSNFVHSHFDILEVCGMENAGLAMSSNRIAVVYARAGSDAINWHKMYDLRNKPIPIELFQKNVPTHLPPTRGNPVAPKVSFGSIACTYGLTLLESFRFASCLGQGFAEEAERLPFVPPFGLHEARGAIRGTMRFVSDFVFHQIDPRAASIDPRTAVQARPLDPQTKKALKEQAQMDARNCAPTTLYMDEMLEHGVVPRDMPPQSPSALALQMERARKWRTQENKIVDSIVEKFDLYEDPYVALEHAKLYSKMLGEIKFPQDFFTWTSSQQENWLMDLVTRAQSCFEAAGREARAEKPIVAGTQEQGISNSNIDFTPDLTTLEPATLDPMQNSWVDPDLLSQLSLNLPWSVNANAVTGTDSLQTVVEIAPEDLEADLPPISSNVPLHRMRIPEEKPSFADLSSFTHFELGPGIGGGYGVIGTLKSGAQVSISTTGTALLTGLVVPLTQGFLTGLGTGLVYTAPIAAFFIAINHVLSRHENEVLEHLKKDNKSAQKEGQRVDASLQNFDYFFELFQSHLIAKEAFLREVNQISEDIHDAAHHMGQRGRYADRQEERGGSGAEYFFSSTKLRQIELDLKKIASEAVVKRDVDERYAPQLRGIPLQGLVKELGDLASKRVLTLSDKYKQDALMAEICIRGKSGDLDALSHLDQLAGRPVAISLNPAGVAKPNHITKKHFWDNDSSQERKYDRVKGWANKLDEAYAQFEKAAKEGNIPEMEKAANDVRYQIQRAKGEGKGTHIHLKDYDLVNLKDPANPKEYCKTAWAYYEPYITTISSNVDTTLARAKAAQSGSVSELSPAIFTPEEIKGMKVIAASDAFNEALEKLKDPSMEGKDQLFSNLHQAALLLNSQGVVDPNVLNVIAIAAEHGTYSAYQATTERLNGIRTKLANLQEKTDNLQKLSEQAKTEEPAETEEPADGENYGALYKSAFEIAVELITERLSEADIRKIIENPDEAQKTLDYVRSVRAGYIQYQSAVARFNYVQGGLAELHALTTKLDKPKLKREDRLKLLKERKEKSEELLKKGLTEEEIAQISIDKEKAPDVFKWVQSIPKEYPHLVRIDHFENDIYHRYSSPLVRLAMHVLNDQQRFHPSSVRLRRGTLALGAVNTLTPDLLPSVVNVLFARGMKENVFVVGHLYKNCVSALRSNALATLKGHVTAPRAFMHKSLSKKATALQGANAVVQLVARGVSACVSERIGTQIDQSALVLNATTNALYCTSICKKTLKYLKAGKFALKAHKVGQGLLSLGTSGFDIYEFLATDASEWGTSKEFMETIKFYLPTFHGNLPEDRNYYIGKDLANTTAAAASYTLIGGPLLTGIALFQGLSMVNNICTSRYTDDVLSAIMINYRYFARKSLRDEKFASMKNLRYYLGENLKVEDFDTPTVRKAKHCEFEYSVDDLAYCHEVAPLKTFWKKLIDLTEIDLATFKFIKRNIALSEAIEVVLNRYTALLNFGPEGFLQSFDECEKVSDHLNQQFSKMAEKHRLYIESVKSNLQNIKQCFLTNFCIYYLTKKLEVTPMVVLMMFDKIAKEKRDCVHWYCLGQVADNLWEKTKRQKQPLIGLQLVCFEAAWEMLEKKRQLETLNKFEEELIPICEQALRFLKGQVKEPLSFSKETERFTPVVEEILSN